MTRVGSPDYRFWIYLTLGELVVADVYGLREPVPIFEYSEHMPYIGPHPGSPKVVRLDPAAVGKAIHAHVRSHGLQFTTETTALSRVHKLCGEAAGVSSMGSQSCHFPASMTQ